MNDLQTFEQNNKELLQSFLDDYNPGHDYIQMEYFIVGQGITDYGKYRQAIAEINSHYEALKTNYVKQKRLHTERKLLFVEKEELPNETPEDELRRELKDIDVEEIDLQLDTINKQIARNLNELETMFVLAKKYVAAIEGKDRTELIKEYQIARLAKQLAVNTVWRGGNLSGVMDTITTLPDELQTPLLNDFSNLLVAEQHNASEANNQAKKLLSNK